MKLERQERPGSHGSYGLRWKDESHFAAFRWNSSESFRKLRIAWNRIQCKEFDVGNNFQVAENSSTL